MKALLLKHQQFLLVSAILLIAGTEGYNLYRLAGQNNNKPVPVIVAPLMLQWRTGISQQYDVKVDSTFNMNPASFTPAQPVRVLVDGILDFHTLDSGPAGVLVGMRFSALQMSINAVPDAETSRALSHPFLVLFAPDGIPVLFQFVHDLSFRRRAIIVNIVRNFQMSIVEGESWVTQEMNASGIYSVEYLRSTPENIQKSKKGYLETIWTSETGTMAEVTSKELILLDANRDWVSEMTVDEKIYSTDPEGPFLQITRHASLRVRTDTITYNPARPDTWTLAPTAEPSSALEVPGVDPAL